MVLAKSHRLLEQRFPTTNIQWIEFPAGPQMLEALNVGSIDRAAPVISRRCLLRPPGRICCMSARSHRSRRLK